MTISKEQIESYMTERAEAQRRQEVRDAASAYLRKWGLDGTLPTGAQGDPGECVFAHALGGSWNGSTWQLSEQRGKILAGCWKGNPDEGFVLDLPEEVCEFIHRFDGGEYPDLVEGDPGLEWELG
jgi:hypothetical protein